jgi:hypothetical protein
MSLPVIQYRVVPGTGAWHLDDIQLLAQLGVLHRRKPSSRLFYVNSELGDDSYKWTLGNDFKHPMKTLAKTLELCTSAQGDFIVVQGSSTDFTEEDVSIAIADLTIVGTGPLNGGNSTLKPDAATTNGILSLTAAADNVMLKNLVFNTATCQDAAIYTASGVAYLQVIDCTFSLIGAAGPTGYGINTTAGAVTYPIIKGCIFNIGTLVAAGIALKAGTSGALIENCTFVSTLNGSGTGCADAINVMAGTGVVIKSCHIHGGDASTAYNIVDGIDIDAGVINTLITGPCYIGGCDNALTDGGTDTIGGTNGIVALS